MSPGINEEKKCHLPEEMVGELAEFFKMFGDSTRLRILVALSGGEKNVQTLTQELSMTQSAISHQVRLLKQMRLIKSRREGIYVYYSLDDDHVSSILRMGVDHVLE